MTTSPQQQNATRQRERVAERVYAAIASMQSEIDALGGHFKTVHPWALQNRSLGCLSSRAK